MVGIHDTLHTAQKLWREMTELDPQAKSIMFSNWSLRETFEELAEAVQLDPTQITAILLLAHYANSYFADRMVSMRELLESPESIREALMRPRQLMALLGQSEVSSAREAFITGMTRALESYSATAREDVQALLAAPHELAVLRRDALRSMANLKVHQFLDGEPEGAHIRPVYNKTVHQWWNIQSLIAGAMRLPSGVSLNLVRHPDAFQSYFCFAIRNGARIYILTDVEAGKHPLAAGMARRPDRDLSRRAQRNWFPYELLNLRFDEESGRLYEQESKQRGLVAFQNEALPLSPVSELEPRTLAWVAMMFDLLLDRFWRQDYQAAQLSYTAEMLNSDRFIEQAKSANLPALVYQPVALAPLSRIDVSSANVTEAEVGSMCHQPNAWLEQRYGAAVPESVLNLMGAPEDVKLLDKGSAVAEVSRDARYHELTDWQKRDVRAGRIELEKLDATSFGSREKLHADRVFIARANYARAINQLAESEFNSRRKEVYAQYVARVNANLPTLLTWVGNEGLWLDDGLRGAFSGYEGQVGHQYNNTRLFINRLEDNGGGSHAGAIGIGGLTPDQRHYACAVNGTRASFHVLFSPAVPSELALLAGCSVEELPEVLQHWSRLRPYTGNSILDRVDPLIWNAANPWLALDLRVRVHLSKRAMAQLLKQPVVVPPLPNIAKKAH